jgi:hypothetical protein
MTLSIHHPPDHGIYLKGSLTTLKFEEVGNVDLQVENEGVIGDAFWHWVGDLVLNKEKYKLLSKYEDKLRDLINKALKKYKLPV